MELLKPENAFVSFSTWKFDRFYCIFSCAMSLDLTTGTPHEEFSMPGLRTTDMANFFSLKPKGEFYLLAKAFPPSPPSPCVRVAVHVGRKRKELMVFGDRFWVKGAGLWRMSEPEPFSEMEISWERAFGGPEFAHNPLGKGIAPLTDPRGGKVHPLPNVEDPYNLVISPRDRVKPVSFCPYGPSWPQRIKKTGTFDDKWLKTRWPWLPEDFDPSYYNAAPEDQQIEGFFNGDEDIKMENMHPEHAVMETRLPGLKALGFITRKNGTDLLFQEVRLNLDTIWLVPHEETGLLVWHGLVETRYEDASDIGHFMVVFESLGEEPRPLEHYHTLFLETLAGKEEDELEEDIAIESGEKEAAEAVPEEAGEEDAAKAAEAFSIVPLRTQTPDEKAESELIKRLEQERRDAEQHLKKTLASLGISPEAFLKGPKGPSEPPGPAPSARETIESLRKVGIQDPDLERQLMEMEKEVQKAEEEAERREEPASDTSTPASVVPHAEELDASGKWRAVTWTREDVIAHYEAGRSLAGALLVGLDLSNLDLRGVDLRGAVLDSVSFQGSNLEGADLSDVLANKTIFDQCILSGARLIEASCEDADFTRADLNGAELTGAILAGSKFIQANLERAVLKDADLCGTEWEDANLDFADLSGAEVVEARLEGISMRETVIEYADFSGSILKRVDLSSANGAESSFYGTTGSEVKFSCAKLPGSRADKETKFFHVDFYRADLNGACWEGAGLEGANFKGARLDGANFSKANLTGADFYHASAKEATFTQAIFDKARLSAANFFRAGFEGARFRETDFKGANLYEAEFWKAFFENVVWEKANLKMTKLFGKVET